jgi:hypothetical protein
MKRVLISLMLACLVAGCSGQTNSQSGASPTPVQISQATAAPVATSTEPPLPAESNPPGDISDTQAFVSYSSAAGGYSLDSPEGWARSVHGSNVSFIDKFDGTSVTIALAPARSHAPDATHSAIDALQRSARAGRDFQISPSKLPGGAAVVVTFTSNSNPDQVTGKRVRLENRAIVFERGPKTATILLWAPLGADNVDQWNRIGSSFRWH